MNVYRFSTLLDSSDYRSFLIGLPSKPSIWVSFSLSQSTNFPPVTNSQISTIQGPHSIVKENSSHNSLQMCVFQLKPQPIIYKLVSLLLPPIHSNYLKNFSLSTSSTHHVFNNVLPALPTAPERPLSTITLGITLLLYFLHTLSLLFLIISAEQVFSSFLSQSVPIGYPLPSLFPFFWLSPTFLILSSLSTIFHLLINISRVC